MLIYLLKANFLIIIFTAAYWLLLRKGKLLQLNRLILVASVLLAFLLPAVPMTKFFSDRLPEPVLELTGRAAAALPILDAPLSVEPPATESIVVGSPNTPSPTSPSWPLAIWVYLAVAAFLFFLLVRQFVHIFNLILYSTNTREDGLTLVHTDEDIPPFSFFRFLVINPAKYAGDELRRIIVHEKVHIRQAHYLDILVGELLRVVCWYNPAAWALNALLKMNLEYIADRQVLSTGINRKNYQYQLLSMKTRGQSLRLTTPLNYSPLKMRISMMNAKKTGALAQLRYALCFPVLLLSLLAINPALAQETKVVPGQETKVVGKATKSDASATTVVKGYQTPLNGKATKDTEGATTVVKGYAATTEGEAKATTVVKGYHAPIYGDAKTIKAEDIYFVIRPTIKRKVLMDAQEALAQKGIMVKYNNLNFNDGKLTAISVSIQSDDFSGNLSYDPLEGPLVFYDLQLSDKITGFEYGTPKRLDFKQQDTVDHVTGLLVKGAGGAVMIRGAATID